MSNPIQNPDDLTVLIPAAGRVPEGLLSLSNIGCTALIPVAGRPVIYWTLNYLRSLGLRRFRIAVPKRGLFVEDFVECTIGPDCEATFVVPRAGPEGGVGETVASLLDFVDTRGALTVLGDTYFQFADPAVLDASEPFVLTSPVKESYRWCVAEADARGYLVRLHDKEKGLPEPLEALIGVYFFPDTALARRAAREAVDPDRSGGGHIELFKVLDRLHARSPIRVRPAGQWLDCGNPDRQAASHVALLQKREFNELAIDPVLATITKKSRLRAKFFDEINYLRLLPRDLSVLFPRVLDYSLDWEGLSLTMEYYGYTTLAEVFVYENMDPGIWERVFSHLLQILTGAFRRYRQPLPAEVMVEMYLTKTSRRVASMQGPPELQWLKDARRPVRINGRDCPSLAMVWPRIEADVRKMAAAAEGCVVHGDLCFSNILYDLRSQICKFVDPRGSFGAAGIMGDPRYDVAKLYHSVLGLYDFITNDLFHYSIRRAAEGGGGGAGGEGGVVGPEVEVSLDIRYRTQHRQILERFENVFFPRFDRREILLLTGLIFAGIPALHYDKPGRQIAMYARALQIFAGLYPLPVAEGAVAEGTTAVPPGRRAPPRETAVP